MDRRGALGVASCYPTRSPNSTLSSPATLARSSAGTGDRKRSSRHSQQGGDRDHQERERRSPCHSHQLACHVRSPVTATPIIASASSTKQAIDGRRQQRRAVRGRRRQ